MRAIKTIALLAVVLFATTSARKTYALPSSTYADANGWQGFTTYTENGLDLLIQFTVYDAWDGLNEFTWAGAVEMPDTDQYIYAYQIFSNRVTSTEDIDYFGVLDIDGGAIAQSAIHSTTTQPDETGLGISPDPNVSVVQGSWQWSQEQLLEAGKYSTWLIFSSPNPPTPGTFEVKAAEEQENPLVVPSPEPSMIALFGLGMALLFNKQTAGKHRSRRRI